MRKGIGGHHRPYCGKTQHWLTPPRLLVELGPFDLDPCACPGQPWRTAETQWEKDGLDRAWFGRVWLNPPYGPYVGKWLARLAAHNQGTTILFARTDTEAFHQYVWNVADALLFLRGRLHFYHPDGKRAPHNAGGPSVLVSYGGKDAGILRTMAWRGKYIYLRTARLKGI